MKRVPSDSLEKPGDIKDQKVEDNDLSGLLYSCIAGNHTRDYHLLKQRLGTQFSTQLVKTLFTETQQGLTVKNKNDNAFFSAFYSVGSSAVSQGVAHTYAFEVLDLRTCSTHKSASDLDPFVFTLVCISGNHFQVLVNRLNESIEITLKENLFDTYRTFDLRTISSSRLIDDIGRDYTIPTEHHIFQDVLATIATQSTQHAYALLDTIPFNQLCSALGVARVSFLRYLFDFLQLHGKSPSDMIGKDNFLLIREVIYGGAFNRYHTAIDTRNKLTLIFQHIENQLYMKGSHLLSFIHQLLVFAIDNNNHEAMEILLSKVTETTQRKELFELKNFRLFTEALQCKNVDKLILSTSMLEASMQKKMLALAYLLAYNEIQQHTACLRMTRDQLLRWLTDIPNRTEVIEVREKAKALHQEIERVQSSYSEDNPQSYQFSEVEQDLRDYFIKATQGGGHGKILYPLSAIKDGLITKDAQPDGPIGLRPLAISHELLEDLDKFIARGLPILVVDFDAYGSDDWQKAIRHLFDLLAMLKSYPAANWLMYRFMPLSEVFYQTLLKKHFEITDIDRPNEAIVKFMSKLNFKAALWSHQLDLVHHSKVSIRSVSLMGTRWHSEVLRTLEPMYTSIKTQKIKTNFAICKMTFVITNTSGERYDLTLPLNIDGKSSKYCPSLEEIEPIYQFYKGHGQSLVQDQHKDDAKYKHQNLPHSEKSIVHYLHQNGTIANITAFIEKFIRGQDIKSKDGARKKAKLHSIILDIISTNQCCKTCHLLLIGLQNSHLLNNGFLNRLTAALFDLHIFIPKNKVLRMTTRYSSFQPMSTPYTIVTGNTPDITPKDSYNFEPNTILYSNTHIEPPLNGYPISSQQAIAQFAEQQHLDHQNTVKNIIGEEQHLKENYEKKHSMDYCGTEPLSLKQLVTKTKHLPNPVIIFAPQQTTVLYLRQPPATTIALCKYSLFCSGTTVQTTLDTQWQELQRASSESKSI